MCNHINNYTLSASSIHPAGNSSNHILSEYPESTTSDTPTEVATLRSSARSPRFLGVPCS
ncbi:hypothetical protein NITHO_500011 [Nitrolancea hollandica Lb]|uniref:Uncharacterized protein n=1 Tax=Nitrolancea hollandica Lb TaxID=1129897 RepID=I4ELB4_9BACT|nr:hypothetical protein NITHO_500011 [Nitrolancea hollandica Lb]